MGKSNRIRTKRAEEALTKKPLETKKVKKETPSWLYSVIAIVLAIGVIIGVAATIISSSGMVLRNTTALKSENYKMSASMLQYLYRETYQNFVTNNQSNLSYFSLDTEHDPREQIYGDTTKGSALETTMLGEFEGTWFEYFMSKAKEQASEVLVYCEEADKRGIKLEDADYDSIDATLAEIDMMVMLYNSMGYNYTTDSYIAMTYGKGIKERDVRGYLELYTLATKCASIVGEELMDAITDDRINSVYTADQKSYDLVDYDLYTIRVDYDDLVEELYGKDAKLTEEQEIESFNKYKEKILEAKALAAEFAAITDAEDFEAKLLGDVATKAFDESYKTEALAKADEPSEDALAAIKTALVAKVFEDIASELDAPSDDTAESKDSFTAYGETVTKNAATALDNIKSDVFEAIKTANEDYILEKVSYLEGNDVSEWAFASTATVGSVKTESEGDLNESETDITTEKGYFETTVYLLKKTAYRDEDLSKKVAYMIFSSKENAYKAIAALDELGEVTEEAFLSAGSENSATASEVVENYLEGEFGYASIDKWLYDEATVKGSYTDEPLALSTTEGSETFGVFMFIDDAEPAWLLEVKSGIYADDADAKYIELIETYPVDFLVEVVDKISA